MTKEAHVKLVREAQKRKLHPNVIEYLLATGTSVEEYCQKQKEYRRKYGKSRNKTKGNEGARHL